MTIRLQDWSRIRNIRRYQGPLILAGVLAFAAACSQPDTHQPPQARHQRPSRSPGRRAPRQRQGSPECGARFRGLRSCGTSARNGRDLVGGSTSGPRAGRTAGAEA